ncbi:Basal-body rod modification protein FlgD [Ruegeria denitrificans]|uniref:Basal-body rod modification protein FlgD n=1 Tax=Ruegeria denitrificans TaxID=1715692 RepID=A0A0N7MAI2_9RHOB|nr:flagellar hook capping FlgD N-terminal domain-containing protein [Ruegeria denitrificans]CUK11985.1 Basal-body rod modification protein FlgD [Ruegeria denitrificans]
MITPTQLTAQANTQTQSASQSQTTSIASDFDTFLLLMTTQAQNQDPLEPMDSSEYASQLAQFSMVEQQVQSNDLLSELALSLGGIKLEELASWVGMDVQTTAAFHFDGEPVTLSALAPAAADSAVMVIRDRKGAEIERISVQVTQTEFAWAGTANDGSPLPTGSYSATLESYDGEELLSAQPVSTYNQVVEAQVGEDAVLLTLESGQVVPVGMVTGVRAGT